MTIFSVVVTTSTHDMLKAGLTRPMQSFVTVEAENHVEAKLLAAQIAAHGDRMPVRTELACDTTPQQVVCNLCRAREEAAGGS